MEHSALSLLPPILVLLLGFFTRRVLLSLFIGILCASLLATHSLVEAPQHVVEQLFKVTEFNTFFDTSTFWSSWNPFICIFLFSLGTIISMIHLAGGAYAYKGFVSKFIRKKRHAESASLLLSTALFIDDYFSSLTVGSVMTPITDELKIPRAKLAFLVDAMAAPLAILCPFSSWVAAIMGFLRDNGIHANLRNGTQIIAAPFSVYLELIPYLAYSFLLVITSWFIVLKGISFGLMEKYEYHAEKTGDVFYGQAGAASIPKKASTTEQLEPSLLDFFVPIGILIGSIVCGLLYSGDFHLFGGSNSLVDSLRNASAPTGLFIGGISAICASSIFLMMHKRLAAIDIPRSIFQGCKLMLPSVSVLILAWTLGETLRNDLHTGSYVAQIISDSLPESSLPAIFFICSTIIAVALGSSWGTAAIMFPIAIQLVISLGAESVPVESTASLPILIPVLGAILSGCVAGDHISPISDTTVMSSTSTGMNHSDHVYTQMTYSVPLIIITALTYSLWGVFYSHGLFGAYIISACVAVLLSLGFFSFRHKTKIQISEYRQGRG